MTSCDQNISTTNLWIQRMFLCCIGNWRSAHNSQQEVRCGAGGGNQALAEAAFGEMDQIKEAPVTHCPLYDADLTKRARKIACCWS